MLRSVPILLLLAAGAPAITAPAALAADAPKASDPSSTGTTAAAPTVSSPTATPALDQQPALLPDGTEAPKDATSTAAVTSTKEIVLELRKRTISLLDDGKVLGSWPVAIGDSGTPTPTGRFTVETKVVNPQYQSTKSGKVYPTKGPNSQLGDRWIGFKQSGINQYGIHGTPSAWAWTVNSRAAVTNGCVRMLTPHVRILFDQVDVGTPVVVKP